MRPTFKLIPDFIIPHLERETYGHHLIWEDKKKGSFKISRIHQSSELWSDDCIAVYKAWSLKKKLWKPEDLKNITKAKHRLITALRRSPVIEVLCKEPAYYRFQFIHPNAPGMKSNDASAESSGPLVELENNTDFDNDKNPPTIIHDKQTKMKEVYITVINTTTSNETMLNLPSCELENKFKDEGLSTPNLSGEVFPSLRNSEDNNTWCSGECCCDILLDSTLLCNERCIWHGIYS